MILMLVLGSHSLQSPLRATTFLCKVNARAHVISNTILCCCESTMYDSPKLITLLIFSIHQAMNVTRSYQNIDSLNFGVDAIFIYDQ